jgi:hypothetical protein
MIESSVCAIVYLDCDTVKWALTMLWWCSMLDQRKPRRSHLAFQAELFGSQRWGSNSSMRLAG